MPCASGPTEPHSEIRGNLATFLALSSADALKSPIIVKLVHTTAELTMPAKNLNTAQLARLVANPMLKQQTTILHSPISVTRRRPMRSAR